MALMSVSASSPGALSPPGQSLKYTQLSLSLSSVDLLCVLLTIHSQQSKSYLDIILCKIGWRVFTVCFIVLISCKSGKNSFDHFSRYRLQAWCRWYTSSCWKVGWKWAKVASPDYGKAGRHLMRKKRLPLQRSHPLHRLRIKYIENPKVLKT